MSDFYEVMERMDAIITALPAGDYKRYPADSPAFQHAYRVPDQALIGDAGRHLEFIIQPLRSRITDRARSGHVTRMRHEIEVSFQYEMPPNAEVPAQRLSYRAALDIARAVCDEGNYEFDVEVYPDIAYEFTPSGDDKFLQVRSVFAVDTTESI